MKVAVHQPEFLPYPGFFQKMAKVDYFVVLDDVQYTKNNWQNRNRIWCPNKGETFLTTPVILEGHTSKTIREMQLSYRDEGAWQIRNIAKLQNNYGGHQFFSEYWPELHQLFSNKWDLLISQNLAYINFLRTQLEISTPLLFSSELQASGNRSSRLANIAVQLGCSTYVSGLGAKQYLDIGAFQDSGIEVLFQEPNFEKYRQESLNPHLSALDALMKLGARAKSLFV